ncbi:hypothetical protein TPA0909_49280 [Streptomyces albus]|nr:hypothetical protein TPA0909_49280 [Streptomyces albus]
MAFPEAECEPEPPSSEEFPETAYWDSHPASSATTAISTPMRTPLRGRPEAADEDEEGRVEEREEVGIRTSPVLSYGG